MNEVGFEQVLDDLHPMIRAAISRNYHNCRMYEVDPGDVYQEICLVLWALFQRRGYDGVFRAIAQKSIYRTIRHVVFYASQHRGHRPFNPDRPFVKYRYSDEWMRDIACNADFTGPEAEEFVSCCPESHRKIVTMLMDGATQNEISDILEVSARTIDRRIAELRSMYLEYCGETATEVIPDRCDELRGTVPGARSNARSKNHCRAVPRLSRRESS